MYIQEAVKESLTSGKWIQRRSWLTGFAGKIMILPTNTHDCCITGSLDYKTGIVGNRSKYWNPKAEDLVADDWEMISDQRMTELIDQGKITPNQARELLGLPPVNGGDQLLIGKKEERNK